MLECATRRAVDLRHAAQAVGILHPRIVMPVRLANLALSKQFAQMPRRRYLPGMGPRLVNPRVKRSRCPHQSLKRHGAGQVK